MKYLATLCFWCLVLYLVRAEFTNETADVTAAEMIFLEVESDRIINITEQCSQAGCINKCCPKNQILNAPFESHNRIGPYNCIDGTDLITKHNLDYSEVDLYVTNIHENIVKSSKKIWNLTQIYSNNFIRSYVTSEKIRIVYGISELFKSPENEFYVLENGRLKIRRLNYYNQWIYELATDNFCIEYETEVRNNPVTAKPRVVTLIATYMGAETNIPKNTITAYALLVSAFFLVLVLVVYGVLPQLRNLAGMMLMAYSATFIIAIIFRAVLVLGTDSEPFSSEECLYIGFIAYYAILASYTWINVMSFDIWWTMRGFRNSRQINRRGVLVKFGWYSLYGWGAPLVPVVFSIVVQNLDLTHLPNFVKPHYNTNKCFIQEGERLLYMNGPILILTCINIALFLMTAYNIWRIKTGVTKYSGDSKRNENQIRFGIYVKLSLVMGIFWILEVVSSVYYTDSLWWYIPDLFNCLVGFFIFIIFVCKRNIFQLFSKRFSIGEDLVQKWQTNDTTRTTRE